MTNQSFIHSVVGEKLEQIFYLVRAGKLESGL
jgi:hypothetical protein